MTSIKETLRINRRISITVGLLVLVFAAFMLKFYFTQKRENRALRIKLLSLQENRRTPKPWAQLLAKAQRPATAATSTTATALAPATGETGTATPADNGQTIDGQDTQELAEKLNTGMRRIKSLEVEAIDNNIAIANELISREPDSYSAYKAKLISLLTKEGKFNQPLDDSEIESTLESMAQFNTGNDNLARREAALIGNSSIEIQAVETQLEEVARQRETLESQLTSFDPASPEFAGLTSQMQQLDDQELQLVSNIETLENNLINNRAQIANEDVVEIPFMRMLAKNDLDGVIDNATILIDQFPNSPNGYYYLVKALEMRGLKEEARQIIQTSSLPQDAQQTVLQRLESQSAEDPKNYWQKLSF